MKITLPTAIGRIDLPYETFTFSGGEEHIRLNLEQLKNHPLETIQIKTRLTSSQAIMQLIMMISALRQEFGYGVGPKYELFCSYFPYARQDRVCNRGEAFGALRMAELINQLYFDQVYIVDPHSGLTPALLNNCIVMPQSCIFELHYMPAVRYKTTMVVSPDKGASKKARDVQRVCGIPKFLQASKIRDSASGDIIATVVEGDVSGQNILIPDDICDGGRTFIELAKILKEKGAGTITLFVTHGIFSKGFKPFEGLIDSIITTDSFRPKEEFVNDSNIPLQIIEL